MATLSWAPHPHWRKAEVWKARRYSHPSQFIAQICLCFANPLIERKASITRELRVWGPRNLSCLPVETQVFSEGHALRGRASSSAAHSQPVRHSYMGSDHLTDWRCLTERRLAKCLWNLKFCTLKRKWSAHFNKTYLGVLFRTKLPWGACFARARLSSWSKCRG